MDEVRSSATGEKPASVSREAALELLSGLGKVLLLVQILRDVGSSAHQEHAGRLLNSWASGLAHGTSQNSNSWPQPAGVGLTWRWHLWLWAMRQLAAAFKSWTSGDKPTLRPRQEHVVSWTSDGSSGLPCPGVACALVTGTESAYCRLEGCSGVSCSRQILYRKQCEAVFA